eukprot:CAMPEP_0172518268 /NCGR_PEP_ID=MMETSP1066-20121228/290714_1 /TAXON_ID=671091 /ORGANISM="Coscinodiscus wailesii, Strain CCMP2513" /LENGTH=651 /DNA_ID=CAMNT_0013300619 /DNA_START=131 /DNA_END=2085 /DNA_ORIENTATION=-
MPTFKSFVLVALLALTRGIEGASLRGPSGSEEERMATIDRAKESFDFISQFLNDVEMNDENVGKIEIIAVKMKDMGPMLTEMRDAMFEEDADADQWRAFADVNDKYSSLMGAVADKLEESVAFVEEKKEDERERLKTLNNVNKFDFVSQFLNDVEMNDENIGKIEIIAVKMKDMGPMLTEMRDAMFEEDADADQWRAFADVNDKYSSLMGAVADKLEESVAFVEEEKEDERESLETLNNVNESFDDVSAFLDNVEITEDSIGRIEAVAESVNKMGPLLEIAFLDNVEITEDSIGRIEAVAESVNKMGPLLEKMNDEMSDGDANMDQWDAYRSTLTRYQSLMKSVNDKLESSYEFVEGLENRSEEEGEIDSKGLVEALRFANEALDNADAMEDMEEVEDVLDYVNSNLDGMNGEVKSKFEEVTEALSMKLNEKRSSFEVADPDSGDERVAALDKVNESLDDVSQFLDDVEMDEESIEEIKKVAATMDKMGSVLVSQFLDDVEMDEESIEKIKKVAVTMDKMGSVLTGMRDEMSEGDADQSRIYGSTLDKFSSVMETVADKLEESAAYAEAENESSDEEVNSADLVDVLNYAKETIDGASFKDDLVAAKDALRYVDGKLKGVDEEMKSKFEEATGSLYMLLNEKSVSFEEDEK